MIQLADESYNSSVTKITWSNGK